MNKIQQHRLFYIIMIAIGLGLATALILYALKQNINVYLTPSQLATTKLNDNYHFRLGGMVKKKSIVREKNSLGISFMVTDFTKEIMVHYQGVVPDLFHEGKGVIAEGHVDMQGIFQANQILAKHDENYMPKQIWKKQHA